MPKLPVVVKPRFGSWGSEVERCDDYETLEASLGRVRDTSWFERHGALVQELVGPRGYDLRIVVAEGRVVGSVFRIAAPGEWRTNVALGGTRRALAQPPRGATTIALAAAAAAGASLVGVDLLPDGAGWTVLELNGAVEMTSEYAPFGDVFAEVADVLGRAALDRLAGRADLAADIA